MCRYDVGLGPLDKISEVPKEAIHKSPSSLTKEARNHVHGFPGVNTDDACACKDDSARDAEASPAPAAAAGEVACAQFHFILFYCAF